MHAFRKFYKKTRQEKWQTLADTGLVTTAAEGQAQCALPEATADQMIENYLGNYSLPLGVAPTFVIDHRAYVIPMVTEEPSVIAAASFGAQIVARNGGFSTTVHSRRMIGQVALMHVTNPQQAETAIRSAEQTIIDLAHQAYPSIVARGGGVRHVWTQYFPTQAHANETLDFLVCYLSVDTQEAMGANMMNTMLEAITPLLEELTGGSALMGILSNYATDSLVTANCRIAPTSLQTEKISGEQVRDRIVAAYEFAMADPYRAATHNKGIMNGIDALVIASGNDWRAIEAGAHAYASRNGQYQPLTTWTVAEDGYLEGSITLPLPVGTVGGSIAIHPTAKLSHHILQHPTAEQLARLIASLGLAQNLAALRALVTEGIQKGHMALQIKSLALSSGASPDEVPQLIARLTAEPHRNLDAAKRLLQQLRQS